MDRREFTYKGVQVIATITYKHDPQAVDRARKILQDGIVKSLETRAETA